MGYLEQQQEKDLKDKEKAIRLPARTYFGGKKQRVKDLAEVLDRMIVKREHTNTIFKTSGRKSPQCSSGRRRSVQDCYLVAKTYLPGITYDQVDSAMTKLKENHIIMKSWCGNVQRYVHYPAIMAQVSQEKVREILNKENVNVTKAQCS